MKKLLLLSLLGLIGLSSCIKEDVLADFVPPVLRVLNPVDTVGVDTTYKLEVSYFNSVGKLDPSIPVTWTSSDTTIAKISSDGLISPVRAGAFVVKIKVEDNGVWVESKEITIGANTVESEKVKIGTIRTTSSYVLRGGFTAEEINGNLIVTIDDSYLTTDILPGLVLYLSNNPTTTNGALEVGAVTTFSGAHTYTIPNVGINDYSHLLYFCKPFNVKVGDGALLDK